MAAYPITTPSLFGGGVTGAGGDWGGMFRLPWFGGLDIGIGGPGQLPRPPTGGTISPSPAPTPYPGATPGPAPGYQVQAGDWLARNKALVAVAVAGLVAVFIVAR